MVTISVVYQGDLRTQASHGPSHSTLVTDAPVDNQGKGASFSPTDLVATALATCMLTTMGIVAKRHGWVLDGATATVEKHMVADPERRIGRLPVTIRVPHEFGEKERTMPCGGSGNPRGGGRKDVGECTERCGSWQDHRGLSRTIGELYTCRGR